MALKNVVQWLVCLMLGGIVGYQLRSPQAGPGASVSNAEMAAKKAGQPGFGPSLSGEAPESKKKEGEAAAANVSLGERMKALLDGYDSKSAKKAIEALSESEIQAALSLLATMPKSSERDSLRANLYAAWAKTNPNAAWKSAVAADTDGYASFIGAVAGEVAKTRPTAAMDLALSLGMGKKRSYAMQSIFNEWGKVDAASAVAYFNKHPDLPADSWAIGSVIYTMADKDPLRAGALALTIGDQQARNNAVQNVMRRWATDDPKAALAWAQSIGNVVMQQDAIAQAIGGWASKDPAGAMAAAQAITDASIRASATQGAWSSWFEKDPNAAITFLSTSGDEKLLNQVGWRLSNGEFTSDEVNSMLAKLPEGKSKEEVVRNVVDNDIRKGHYTRAIEQLNSLPDSSSRDYSLQRLGKQWAEADPKAAEAWLKLQPDSSDRDVAVSGFATSLARTDVQSAIKWAESIPDDQVKSGTLKNISLRWLGTDPAKANAWLEKSSGWSADEIKGLRENAQKYGPDRFSYGSQVKNRH